MEFCGDKSRQYPKKKKKKKRKKKEKKIIRFNKGTNKYKIVNFVGRFCFLTTLSFFFHRVSLSLFVPALCQCLNCHWRTLVLASTYRNAFCNLVWHYEDSNAASNMNLRSIGCKTNFQHESLSKECDFPNRNATWSVCLQSFHPSKTIR